MVEPERLREGEGHSPGKGQEKKLWFRDSVENVLEDRGRGRGCVERGRKVQRVRISQNMDNLKCQAEKLSGEVLIA